jgi:hypothetical protein
LHENHNGCEHLYHILINQQRGVQQVQVEEFESVAEFVLKYWCYEKPNSMLVIAANNVLRKLNTSQSRFRG